MNRIVRRRLAVPRRWEGLSATASRHRAFAGRLLRPSTRARFVAGIEMLLRRTPAHVLERIVTATRSSERSADRPADRRSAIDRPPATTTRKVHERIRIERSVVIERSHRIVHDLLRHTERLQPQFRTVVRPVERAAQPSLPPPTIVRSVERTPYPPVARTVTRAPLPATPDVAGRPVHRPSAALPAAVPPAPMLPAELTRVTDHVIGELDRRVRSHRERMGRF